MKKKTKLLSLKDTASSTKVTTRIVVKVRADKLSDIFEDFRCKKAFLLYLCDVTITSFTRNDVTSQSSKRYQNKVILKN
ncbi:hypothetical protein RN001_010700 [Aquatica leii]|uniref:Uncharacterized protein n=1 Tax=Aquatica leii TaxID=1421715 RepID=A0AAN7PV53_9COLE|nr:hypothetical protein RN001_010700 [Aquatica leii]